MANDFWNGDFYVKISIQLYAKRVKGVEIVNDFEKLIFLYKSDFLFTLILRHFI
jgi:hypothetical protein